MSLIDSIIGAESGGNPNAKNPNSTATGPSQFIESTWLSMLAKHRPDLTGSREELLALRTDPALSRQMTEAYAADNQGILTKNGLEASPGNTYLAHFAGPQGAVKLLSADPSTPVSSILDPAAVKANPFLQGMTAADLQAWASRKVGGKPQPVQPATPVTHANPPSAPLQLAQLVPPIFAPPVQQTAQQPQQGLLDSMPVEQMQMPPPIFAPPKRQIDISKLRMARFGGPFSFRG